ncbi:MAG: PilW family protein [Luteimonas sp.]
MGMRLQAMSIESQRRKPSESRSRRIGMLVPHPHAREAGFGLIELMVAMVLGLIVVGAVLALVVSIMRSNRQTLQATRLTQELRATLSVVSSDLRRARSVDDPLSAAVLVAGNPYKAVSTAAAGCVIYGYDGAANGPWHVIKLVSGKVVLLGSATLPANCSPDGTPITIGSDQVEVTSLAFTPTTTTSAPPLSTDESVVRDFTVTISGRLVDQDAELASVVRTVSQDVYVRSVGAGI